MQVQSHARLHHVTPTDLLRLHHLLRCMGSGSAADRRQPVKISGVITYNPTYNCSGPLCGNVGRVFRQKSPNNPKIVKLEKECADPPEVDSDPTKWFSSVIRVLYVRLVQGLQHHQFYTPGMVLLIYLMYGFIFQDELPSEVHGSQEFVVDSLLCMQGEKIVRLRCPPCYQSFQQT